MAPFLLFRAKRKTESRRETNPHTIVIPKIKLIDFLTINKDPVSLKTFRVDALFYSPSSAPPHRLYSWFFWIKTRREAHITFGWHVCTTAPVMCPSWPPVSQDSDGFNTGFIRMHRKNKGRRLSSLSIFMSSGSLTYVPSYTAFSRHLEWAFWLPWSGAKMCGCQLGTVKTQPWFFTNFETILVSRTKAYIPSRWADMFCTCLSSDVSKYTSVRRGTLRSLSGTSASAQANVNYSHGLLSIFSSVVCFISFFFSFFLF